MNVLVVDDNPDGRLILRRTLEAAGHRVRVAADGAEALELARAEPPDVIVSDVLMPRMDGFALCRAVKEDPALAGAAFVFYTATYVEPEDEALGLRLGAACYLMKPADPDEVVRAVEEAAGSGAPAAPPPEGLEAERAWRLAHKLDQKVREVGLYRTAFEQSPVPMLVAGADGRLEGANPAARRWFGFDGREWVGRPLADLLPADAAGPGAWARLERGEAVRADWEEERAGEARAVRCLAFPVQGPRRELLHAVWLLEDVTAERRLARHLQEAGRYETVGRLAAGVAHEFNNLMMVISGAAELLRPGAEGEARRRVEGILHAVDRAREITGRLLAFAKEAPSEPRSVRPAAWWPGAEELVRRALGTGVALEVEGLEDAPAFWADPGRVEQVVLNLALNARDAMPEGGTLRVRFREETVPEGSRRPGLRPGRYLAIEVEDTGPGIPPEHLGRVFDPFFTTKGPDRGTGLGLAVARGLVEAAGGRIAAENRPEGGARFTVLLPTARPGAEDPAQDRRAGAAARGAGETVLLVEDEPAVRHVTAEFLEGLGYRVVVARDGREARERARALGRIDLVLADVALPDGDGRRLAEEIRGFHPEARLLFMSGHLGALAGPAPAPVLPKPFRREELARAVRETLAPGRPTP